MSFAWIHRNVILLTLCQALGMSAIVMISMIGGLIGTDLAPDTSLSTLPNALGIVGVGLGAAPAALWMQRVGRRWGFVSGAVLGAGASSLGAVAIGLGHFGLFCLSFFLLGNSASFVHQYRYAAAESVDPVATGKAISTVLAGTVFAAWLGPEIAEQTRLWLPWGAYSGSFAAMALLLLANAALLSRFRSVVRPPGALDAEGRVQAGARGVLATAVFAGMTAYGVMVLIMTATPIAMHLHDHLSLAATTWVIQSHVIAMYLPSLAAGAIVARFGTARMMLAGVGCIAACIAVAVTGRTVAHYWIALVLLGVGWNFLFIGATTLISEAARGAGRFRVQALNDFCTFGTAAIASLAGGALVHRAGWIVVNLVGVPMLFGILGVLAMARLRRVHA